MPSCILCPLFRLIFGVEIDAPPSIAPRVGHSNSYQRCLSVCLPTFGMTLRHHHLSASASVLKVSPSKVVRRPFFGPTTTSSFSTFECARLQPPRSRAQPFIPHTVQGSAMPAINGTFEKEQQGKKMTPLLFPVARRDKWCPLCCLAATKCHWKSPQCRLIFFWSLEISCIIKESRVMSDTCCCFYLKGLNLASREQKFFSGICSTFSS